MIISEIKKTVLNILKLVPRLFVISIIMLLNSVEIKEIEKNTTLLKSLKVSLI